jgi:rubrerythrin
MAEAVVMPLTVETDRYLSVSSQVEIGDLDWKLAREIGITEDEVFLLTYFSDIEAQTIVYMRDLLHTKAALEPDVIGFLTIWNYEEFFHGKVLQKFLEECGHGLAETRTAEVRKQASLSESLQAMAAKILSWIFYSEFPAVYTSWGAVQELTTVNGYEELGRKTKNPVLRTLCERIVKQERRHFAWYFNSARERLSQSRRSQRLTKWLLDHFWTPVGAGVKTNAEVLRVVNLLFRDTAALRLAEEIDSKIATLPGLEGLSLMVKYMTANLPHVARS